MGDRNRQDLVWFAGAGVAAALVPALALGLQVNFVVALVAAALVMGGIVLVFSPRKAFEGIDVAGLNKAGMELARELLEKAIPQAERIADAARGITDTAVQTRVNHLVEISRELFQGLEKNPASAVSAQRFLTYYLPRTAEIAEGYALLSQQRKPDPIRLQEIDGVLVKLEEAFVHYSDGLLETKLAHLDTDIRLVRATIKEDLGR